MKPEPTRDAESVAACDQIGVRDVEAVYGRVSLSVTEWRTLLEAWSILRAWDLWLLGYREDAELLEETALRTAHLFGQERSTRIDGGGA